MSSFVGVRNLITVDHDDVWLFRDRFIQPFSALGADDPHSFVLRAVQYRCAFFQYLALLRHHLNFIRDDIIADDLVGRACV